MKKTDASLPIAPSITPSVEPGRSKCFWLAGGLLAALMTMIMSRDISQPFIGLHSWAKASGAWAARTHVKYGWGYTKGLSTWAVGEPPPKEPRRYLDQPQLTANLLALEYLVLGTDAEWVYRGTVLVATLAGLVLFLMLIRRLMDEQAAILAGLFYVVFPITGYFGTAGWLGVLIWPAMWNYLVLIGCLPGAPPPGRRHMWGLGLSLFFMLQFAWGGAFYAAAIGLHFLARCLWWRQKPKLPLLLVIVLAPAGSLLITFLIMAGGYGWDIGKIVDLYRWRAEKGEMPTFEWDAWFAYLWRYARTDYTLPPLLLTIGYVLRVPVLALSSWAWRKEREGKAAAGGGPHGKGPPAVPALCPAGFSQWWLLAAPGMLQLIFLRGILWKHQTALLPFTPVVAIAAALAIVAVSRHLAAVLATAVALVIVASLRFVIAALGNVAGTSLNLLTLAILVGGGAIAVSLARRAISTPRKIFARLEANARTTRRFGQALAVTVVACVVAFCAAGTNDYYNIRWQSPVKIAMLKWLNKEIPPNQALLAFQRTEEYMTDQHAAKGSFYRPEIAFYLDRDIVQPASPDELIDKLLSSGATDPKVAWAGAAKFMVERLEAKRREGRYPLFLMPTYTPLDRERAIPLMPLIDELKKKYQVAHVVPAYVPDQPQQVGSPEFYIFDLATPTGGPASMPGN